jgi:thiamine-phosphate pyrophosphorylase
MFVLDRRLLGGRDARPFAREAANGGAGILQIRDDTPEDDTVRSFVSEVVAFVPASRVVLFERARVARTTGTGLHHRFGSPPPDWAGPPVFRKAGVLFGRTVRSAEQAYAVANERPSYLMVGPIYRERTRRAGGAGGTALIEAVHSVSGGIPLFAFGGVGVAHVPELLRAGAHGVAVSRLILDSNPPRRIAEALALALAVGSRGRGT